MAATKRPFDCCWASTAEVHDAGEPIRIAVAMVSGSLTGFTEHQRRGTGGLGAEHAGQSVRETVAVVLGVALPVRGDVARVADRQGVHVGRLAERVDDLERRGLLPFDAIRVDGVDQRDGREVGGELAGQLQAVVEVAVDLDDLARRA